MHADRYHRPSTGPGSLAAAATLTGAIVLGLMSSAPEITLPDPIKKITAIAIPLDPPAPPPEPDRRIDTPRDVETRPVPDRIPVPDLPPLPTDNPLMGEVEVTPIPPADPTIGTATAGDPPAKLLPVLVAAAPDPRFARDFQPTYPPAKERAGEEGRVTVSVLVGADGRVRDVKPVGEVDEAFFIATRRQALSRWRFKPATRDGVAYESWHTISVRFELAG